MKNTEFAVQCFENKIIVGLELFKEFSDLPERIRENISNGNLKKIEEFANNLDQYDGQYEMV